MAERSLGVIVVGTSPKRATSNNDDPNVPIRCTSYRVQHWLSGNTGIGYVGGPNMEAAMGIDVFGVVPTISEATSLSYFSPDIGSMATPHDMATVWIDGTVPGDAFLVTYMV